ncbi:hypothetical protein INS49_013655 [Diaporthe citri]|uniref:uncharacterized protein n=1 Tax=Diaporthe citri TaxID=83186 RepID=UPI001C7EE3A0|nr:uncharacterized protein INS49_013655 [Diaporthe citri]KAG6357776.1 hypothetical protein INS49_013655 [Diaporthe citri]
MRSAVDTSLPEKLSVESVVNTALHAPFVEHNVVGGTTKETIGGHQSIDILADLPQSYSNNADFAAYSAQKQAHSERRPVGYSAEGWKLDRFKFLPMVDKAYQMRLMLTDTLFRFLHQLDPSKPHYMGSPAAGRDGTFFAYGGAGFVLSHGLMKRLVGDSTQLSVRYEDHAENDCCGDAALGYAIMNKTGEPLQVLYPTFAGDELDGLKVNHERWCIPLLALHRVSPEQMESLWTWERTRPYDQHAFTHSTILDYTMSSLHQAPTRASWDNFADVIQPEDSAAHSSTSEWDDLYQILTTPPAGIWKRYTDWVVRKMRRRPVLAKKRLG